MYKTSDKNEERLIKYHRNRKEHKSWLEICDPSVMSTLDAIMREYPSTSILSTMTKYDAYSRFPDYRTKEKGPKKEDGDGSSY
jgi:hypothetical protein